MLTTDEVRELLRRHGEVRPQSPSDWTGTISLPRSIADFYQEVGPDNITIDSGANPWVLPSLADLWDNQTGYRWNLHGVPVAEWKDEWIVVAREAGAGFIHSGPTGRILIAVHGWGDSEPPEIFPNITTMAACFAVLGNIVTDAGANFMDADSAILPKHLAAATVQLRSILASEQSVEFALMQLGWA